MYPNFTCVFTLCLSIFMYNIYLGYETNWCGKECNFEVITFNYIYPFFFKKKTYFKNVSKMCSTKYDSRLPSIRKHSEKFTILTDQIIHMMSLCPSVCNNTVVMWLLFIELIVSFFCKNNIGKIYVTQGKLRENTRNFILARMWPPCVEST